ncbi:MAG: hypothetical protein BWY94_02455 [Actinobacteria bacterium ADurb.BinA094]|nr:MAG: hypothetical protein BWY94_02455 [Actinobacteria bacterium ADurb.BinA094]
MVAPQPRAGDDGAGRVGLGTVGDHPFRAGDRAEPEVVEVVVEEVGRHLPAGGRGVDLLHELLDLRLPGLGPGDQDRRLSRVHADVGRLLLREPEAPAGREERRVRRRRREGREERAAALPPLELAAHPRVGLGDAGGWARIAVAAVHGQRRQAEGVLQCVHLREVPAPVDLRPPDDDEDPARGAHDRHARRRVPVAPRAGEQVVGFAGAGRAPSDVGEVVRPGVDELQDVVTSARVRDVQDERLTSHVADGDRVARVVVGRDELEVRVGQVPHVAELVVGRSRREPAAAGDERGALAQVVHQGIAVDVGLSGLLDLLSARPISLSRAAHRRSLLIVTTW